MLIAVVKTGNIGCSTVLELLLDERAERNDIDVRVVSSGAKMSILEAEYVSEKIQLLEADMIVYATPNATAPGPKKVIEAFSEKNAVVISDAPAVKAKESLEEKGLGYLFVTADAMIGARREFLDPTEMAVFNADILKVLAGTGVIRLIQVELGKTISAYKEGKKYLPKVVVTAEKAVAHSKFMDSSARKKALEAYLMAEEVGRLNVMGCFREKDSSKYIKTVASAHQLLREAALLVDEAREIERRADTLYRTPHNPEGKILAKTKLMEKPK
jgi:methylenetetrahydromethanopterin dehydrogenase